MKTFEDLVLSRTTGDFTRLTYNFDNGFGISVVIDSTEIHRDNCFEVAVIKDGTKCNTTYITDDIMVNLTKGAVGIIMGMIQELPDER